MTSPENLPTQNPAAANLSQPPAEVGLAATVGDLLRSEEVHKLPEADQGAFVVDRFIGHMAALGKVEGSDGQGKDTPQLLKEIGIIGRSSGDAWDKNLMKLTKSEGLRYAVHLLGADARTGQYLTSMSQRVAVKDGKLALGSLDQVRGYLDNKSTEGIANASNWREVIGTDVKMHSTGERQGELRSSRASHDLLSSDIPLVRGEQQDWERAASVARSAGVDMELIDRSTLEIERRHNEGVYIGQQAIANSVVANYDHLLQ
jgi:hypothetical protein